MPNDLKPLIAEVALDLKVDKVLEYLIPNSLKDKVLKGVRVKVPLKSKTTSGIVLALKDKSSFKNLKEIEDVILDKVVLPKDLLELAAFMQKYYLASYHKIMKSLVSTSIRKNVKPKTQVFLSLKKTKQEVLVLIPEIQNKSKKQSTILEFFLKHQGGILQQDLLNHFKGFSTSPIQSLINKNIIGSSKINPNHLISQERFQTPDKKLNEEQEKCFQTIKEDIVQKKFKTHLIHGVTGSGKTEIYIHLIRKCLEKSRSAILLLPEIAITEQMIERFQSRFSDKIAIIHHKRSLGERFDAIDQILKNDAMLIIGARSAVFAPASNLGLIIVDEEHEMSYKQSEESPFYNARDIAIVRGKIADIPVVLGSATPSFESYHNSIDGKYTLSKLKKRASSCTLPTTYLIDMKKEYEKNGGFSHFSASLINKIKDRIQKSEQVILFLNRRGYYASYTCQNCTKIIKCPHCDLALTYHKGANAMRCHLCSHEKPFINRCYSCGSSLLKFKGFGTEHVERSLKGLIPECRPIRMDRDTTSQKKSHETILKEFKSGKKDILIGTQMVTKGLHFPSVTLVGVLNADATLFIPDFRASESVFQTLTQVSGRAGRNEIPGEVVIQTMNPDHPIIQMAKEQNFETFYNYEIESRKLCNFPPFFHLWKIVFSGKDEKKTCLDANIIYKELKLLAPVDYIVQMPSSCAYAKIKGVYRYQIIIHGKKVFAFNNLLANVKSRFANIKFTVDVDPSSTFF